MPTTTTTAPVVANRFPGVTRLVCVASKEHPRYSEGDVIELTDGRLLLAVGRKEGASDYASGTLVGLFSSDGGATWDDEPHVIRAPSGHLKDLMSVSLRRTPRGLHLFFLGRGEDAKRDTLVYQIISTDEGKTWGEPVRVSVRDGYHVVNNARVVRTSTGRLLVPAAYVPDNTDKKLDHQRIVCLWSDDDGVTWWESNELVLEGKPLMEPGVVECGDGSIYMTIRTNVGTIYEARSADGGATWGEFRSSGLIAPAAPATVVRDPASTDLWLFWCDRPGNSAWKQRSRQVVAVSKDHGRTWGTPRAIEDDPKHSYGYISFTAVRGQAILTYYDWEDRGQPGFYLTNLRQRTIPLAWFRGQTVPPVFEKSCATPVLTADQPWEGKVVSINSGVVATPEKWRAWYSNGVLGPKGEEMKVCYAESGDQGRTWAKPKWADSPMADTNVVLPGKAEGGNCYHASVHQVVDELVAYTWHRGSSGESALHRYVSKDGRSFARNPDRPMIAAHNAREDLKQQAGKGRISNDAFDVVRNPDGSWEYFAASIEKATDPRTIVKHDNAAGLLRLIGRSTSPDGVDWSPVDVVLRPDYQHGDPYDSQYYGMQVFRYRRFYLGLLHTFHVQSQTIQPEWAWSHDGENWVRTYVPSIALGDEGTFDSRMILFGSVVVTNDEVVWLYSGYDWRHNAFRKGEVSSSIGRAAISRAELDAWLGALPQP